MTADRIVLIVCLMSAFAAEALPVSRDERHAIERPYEQCVRMCRDAHEPRVWK